MNSDREQILNRLSRRAIVPDLPAGWSSRRRFEDLAGRFEHALQAARGEVYRVGSLEQAAGKIASIFEQAGVERVVCNREPVVVEIGVSLVRSGFELTFPGEAVDFRSACAGAQAGLTAAVAGLVETGTLVLHGGPGCSRLVSLLPAIHIAVLASSQFTGDLFTWTSRRAGKMPAATTLISGPSKTADIEQTMTIGMHGPKRLIVILIEE